MIRAVELRLKVWRRWEWKPRMRLTPPFRMASWDFWSLDFSWGPFYGSLDVSSDDIPF